MASTAATTSPFLGTPLPDSLPAKSGGRFQALYGFGGTKKTAAKKSAKSPASDRSLWFPGAKKSYALSGVESSHKITCGASTILILLRDPDLRRDGCDGYHRGEVEKFLRVKLDGRMMFYSGAHLLEMGGRLGFLIPVSRFDEFDIWVLKEKDKRCWERKHEVIVEESRDMLDGVTFAGSLRNGEVNLITVPNLRRDEESTDKEEWLPERSSLPFPPEKARFHRELEAAVDVVERACRLCFDVKKSLLSSDGRILEKNDRTPVMIADFGVQALISLVAEEDSGFLRSNYVNAQSGEVRGSNFLVDSVLSAVADKTSSVDEPLTSDDVLEAIDRGGKDAVSFDAEPSTYWVLDPIDGTRGFLKGSDALYVVGLPLVVKGEIAIGVMGCPNWKEDNLSTKKPDDNFRPGVIMIAHSGCGTWARRFPDVISNYKRIQDSWRRCFVDSCWLVHEARFCIPDSQTWDFMPLSVPFSTSVDCGDIRDKQKVLLLPTCCGRSSLPFPPEKARFHRELEAAVDVVERACRLCFDVKKSLLSSDGRILEKNDRTPVMIADFGVQALISLVAEEDSGFLRSNYVNAQSGEVRGSNFLVDSVLSAVADKTSSVDEPLTSDDVLEAIDRGGKDAVSFDAEPSTYWVLDPIDGTRGFLKGSDALYVVGLPLVVKGEIAIGVMGCPNWKEDNLSTKKPDDNFRPGVIMIAHSGCGTWARRFPDVITLQLTVGISEINKKYFFCQHAVAGRASVFILRARAQTVIKVWGHAVGVICVHEAGGQVTDWNGSALDLAANQVDRRIIFPAGGVLVTNGA
ncbi:putative PAP-specific phosphatase, mitochondrial [Cocos nucifera]|uniref:Putative PAP-specific phosphatase, mitochondrial n=1 Tax=Cocos nucifera TaxID=13894 RepID=A0A8K0N374_COCNU|nr:putative PAP-specific phosphatase, mitochondrial [Cocos nucifera]